MRIILNHIRTKTMLSPQETLDTYYLEARRDLLEIAAFLDRYDRAAEHDGGKAADESKRGSMLEALSLLSQPDHPKANRTEQLLEHFAKHGIAKSAANASQAELLQTAVRHRFIRKSFQYDPLGPMGEKCKSFSA